ncbi:hypothetical protein GCM10018775_30830 [Streptomyces umbrinus]|nr:hypothetical protein GCM10018775_30830 [Streptomyces umbrinus]
MQMPGRVRLRPQHGLQPVRGQIGQQGVVQDPGRVHHTRQTMIRINTGQQPGQRLTVSDITRLDPHRRTQFRQLRHQLTRTSSRHTPTTHQQQTPHPVNGHQMPGNQRPQTTRTTRNQHRAVRIPRRGSFGGPGLDALQAGTVADALADQQLRFHACRLVQGGQQRLGVRVAVQVGEQDPAGVLHLRGSSQAPNGCPGRVDGLFKGTGHGLPCDDHQGGGREPLLGQPSLQCLQCMLCPRANRSSGLPEVEDDDVRRVHGRHLRRGPHGGDTPLIHLAGNGGRGERNPLHLEERAVAVGRRRTQLPGGDLAVGERVHCRNLRADAVGQRHPQCGTGHRDLHP